MRPKIKTSKTFVTGFILCWHLLQVWGLPFSETLLEKTSFSFANGYQSEITSDLGWGLCSLPLSVLGPSGLDLCRRCVCCHSLYELIRTLVLLCSEGFVSLVSAMPTDSHNHFASSSAVLLELRGEGFDGAIPVRTECSRSLSLCTLSSCGLSTCSHLLRVEISLTI